MLCLLVLGVCYEVCFVSVAVAAAEHSRQPCALWGEDGLAFVPRCCPCDEDRLQGQKQWLLLSNLDSHVCFEVRCSAEVACHSVGLVPGVAGRPSHGCCKKQQFQRHITHVLGSTL
jgi:hypothetical protein